MIHWKTYRNLAALCLLLAIVILLSYRKGVVDERKRWQYCSYYDQHRIEDRK